MVETGWCSLSWNKSCQGVPLARLSISISISLRLTCGFHFSGSHKMVLPPVTTMPVARSRGAEDGGRRLRVWRVTRRTRGEGRTWRERERDGDVPAGEQMVAPFIGLFVGSAIASLRPASRCSSSRVIWLSKPSIPARHGSFRFAFLAVCSVLIVVDEEGYRYFLRERKMERKHGF